MQKNELVQAVEILRDYCASNNTCAGCIFLEEGHCGLRKHDPQNWEFPPVWTEQELALAKALHRIGATSISPTRDGICSYQVYEDGESWSYLLPKGLFSSIRKLTPLDLIIGEE